MTNPKILRWLDLLAALLARRSPATFLDLARDVPAYLTDGSVAIRKPSPTLKRMFERDKLELRELGIPLESEGDEGDEERAYVLRTKDFYLPYLALMTERGLEVPSKVDRYGYHSLATLAFEPDELEAIRDAANRVTRVGDPALSEDARSAMQKLAFDLPLGATHGSSDDTTVISTSARPDPPGWRCCRPSCACCCCRGQSGYFAAAHCWWPLPEGDLSSLRSSPPAKLRWGAERPAA